MLAAHLGHPGSIPGRGKLFINWRQTQGCMSSDIHQVHMYGHFNDLHYIWTVGNPNQTMGFPNTVCRKLPRQCKKCSREYLFHFFQFSKLCWSNLYSDTSACMFIAKLSFVILCLGIRKKIEWWFPVGILMPLWNCSSSSIHQTVDIPFEKQAAKSPKHLALPLIVSCYNEGQLKIYLQFLRTFLTITISFKDVLQSLESHTAFRHPTKQRNSTSCAFHIQNFHKRVL